MKNSDFGESASNKNKMNEEGSFYSEAVDNVRHKSNKSIVLDFKKIASFKVNENYIGDQSSHRSKDNSGTDRL